MQTVGPRWGIEEPPVVVILAEAEIEADYVWYTPSAPHYPT